jgi:cytochrome c biogenesis factor
VIAGLLAGMLPASSRTGTGTGNRGPIRWSTRLGHLGVAVLVVGVAGSTQAERTTVTLQPGERTELGGVTFTHRGVDVIDGPSANSTSVTATLDVIALDVTGQRTTVTLQPALVAHTTRNVLLAETALHSRPLGDVQVVLRSAADDGSARYDLAVTPLVQMVWWGSILIALAGVLIVAGHRRSKHDPSRGDSGDRYIGGWRFLRRSSRVRSSNDAMVADSAATSERATSSRIAASSSASVDATPSVDAPADAPR